MKVWQIIEAQERAATKAALLAILTSMKQEKNLKNFKRWLSNADSFTLRRFNNLTPETQIRAARGIIRHVRACRKIGAKFEPLTAREIILDASNGLFVFEDLQNERKPEIDGAARNYTETYSVN